jgi:hypothetical protein
MSSFDILYEQPLREGLNSNINKFVGKFHLIYSYFDVTLPLVFVISENV